MDAVLVVSNQGDTFFLIIKIKYHHVQFLIEFQALRSDE